MMKVNLSKQTREIILGGIGLSLVIGLGISILIHKLGAIIRSVGGWLGLGKDTETFATIFDQLLDAEVDLPSWLLLILCLLFVWGLLRYFKFLTPKKKSKKFIFTLGIALGIFWILVAVMVIGIVTLWFTDVNEVQFGTVIRFLYNALQHGVF